MNRRGLLKLGGTLLGYAAFSRVEKTGAAMLASPVTTNRLRPPGAVDETVFAGKCIRCGRCVESCPYKCITPLDIRHGLHAGTPLIPVETIPCYLCMKCVVVCPTGSLIKVSQEATRMGTAVINKFTCAAWSGVVLCRTCYDICPFKGKAIALRELMPVVDSAFCTGCGLCTHACPVTTDAGLKAINIEPMILGGVA